MLYPEALLNRTFTVIGKEHKPLEEIIALLSMFPLVLISACKSLRNTSKLGLEHSFDPLVRDQNCQVHSFSFIENFPVFTRGYEKLSDKVTQFLETLPQRLIDDFCEHNYSSSFREIVQKSGWMKFLYEQDLIFEEIRGKLILDDEGIKDDRGIFLSYYNIGDVQYCFDLMQMHLLTVSKRDRLNSVKKKGKKETLLITQFTDVTYLKNIFPDLQSITDAELLQITINNQFYLSRRSGGFLCKKRILLDDITSGVLYNETKEDLLTQSRTMSCFYCIKAVYTLSCLKYQIIALKTKVLNQDGGEVGHSVILFRPNKLYKQKKFKWVTAAEHENYKDQISWVVSGVSLLGG